MKKIGLIIAGAIFLIALPSCGDKNNTASVASGTDALILEEVPDEGEIAENVTYESTGSKGSVSIDASVITPEKIDDCSVYSLEFDFFDDDDVKTLVENIFDEGSYFLYMPYTSEQINLIREKLTAMAPYAKTPDETQAFTDALYNLDYREENLKSGVPEMDGEIKFYNIAEYTEYEDLNEYQCNVFGTIDGKNAVVYFSKDDYNCQMRLSLFGYVNRTVANSGDESYDIRAYGNVCGYTMSEAEDIAKDFIVSMGYENMSVAKSYNTILYSMENQYYTNEAGEEIENYVQVNEVNGYNIYFSRSYGTYNVTYDGSHFQSMYGTCYFDENGENPYKVVGHEFIRVYVSDDGVTDVEFCNPMREIELIADDVVLLDFESINQIAIEKLDSMADEYKDEFKIDEIKLGYSIIEEDGKYAIIPTWSYMKHSDATSTTAHVINYISLNAIDGSEVWCITDPM